jgi:hypothetical protein
VVGVAVPVATQMVAPVNESSKTWTFYTVSAFSPGPHRFTAVVMRSGDDLKGTPSSAYTVNLGNSVSATRGSNVLDNLLIDTKSLVSQRWEEGLLNRILADFRPIL